MIAIDTNVLLPAVERSNPFHPCAAKFLDELGSREDVAISELALLELFGLLRNAAVLARPLTAARAAAVCQAFRNHPRWQVVGLPAESRPFHDELWALLANESFARRRAYDLRMALSLLRLGVTEFATVNLKDFAGLGFRKVWNPLAGG